MATTGIEPRTASGPGALDGFGWTCPTCGMELTSSLRTSLEIDAAAHEAWHEAGSRAHYRYGIRCFHEGA